MSITEAIELLKNYNGLLDLTLHSGASEELIVKVERTYKISLPEDFKTLYRFSDGFETVEDIFNMIPLGEVIKNKKENEPLWIAEYMIYCDSWELEVNPNDQNDYLIFVTDLDYGKIVLTKSLGEFIARFLKGGVFEIGGLYAWADEIRAKIYGNTNPDEIKPLLWVFRECLKRGLMTVQNVVGWADWIIATQDDPHYFFIEISTCHNLNEIITVLDSIHLTDDILQKRAFLGQIYTKLLINKITTDNVISVLETFWRDEQFTAYEKNEMKGLIYLSDHIQDSMLKRRLKQRLLEDTKNFIENYKNFNYHDTRAWKKINADLVEKFENKNA